MSVSNVIEFNTVESWDFARRFASLFGGVPSSFSSTIRGVLTDWERTKTISHGNRFQMLRLLNTGSVKAPLFYAAQTFIEDKIQDRDFIASEDFLSLFEPIDLCALIGMIYLYRRAKRIVVEDEWPFVGNPTSLSTELAGHIGFAIPAIGCSVGILGIGLWNLSYAAFASHDKKGFIEHRRALKIKKITRNEEMEMERWGCCAYQIATVLAQALGLGIQFSEAMTKGLSPDTRTSKTLEKEAYRFSIVQLWAEALETTGKIPNIAHKAEFYPSKGAVTLLEEKVASLTSAGSPYGWLDRGKEDISPELTPMLFSAKGKTQSGQTADADDSSDMEEILTEGEV